MGNEDKTPVDGDIICFDELRNGLHRLPLFSDGISQRGVHGSRY